MIASRAREVVPGGAWFRWGVVLMLSAYLLFAHPCHGDEDTELLTRFWIGG